MRAQDARYDLIYDATFLCSLLPARRADWAAKLRDELLVEHGELVTLIFPHATFEGGPRTTPRVPSSNAVPCELRLAACGCGRAHGAVGLPHSYMRTRVAVRARAVAAFAMSPELLASLLLPHGFHCVHLQETTMEHRARPGFRAREWLACWRLRPPTEEERQQVAGASSAGSVSVSIESLDDEELSMV